MEEVHGICSRAERRNPKTKASRGVQDAWTRVRREVTRREEAGRGTHKIGKLAYLVFLVDDSDLGIVQVGAFELVLELPKRFLNLVHEAVLFHLLLSRVVGGHDGNGRPTGAATRRGMGIIVGWSRPLGSMY